MMEDKIFLAWAAGFFDGEGCVLVELAKQKGCKHGFRTALHATTSDSYERKRGAALVWRWKASSVEAHAFLKSIEPYVVVKAEQVRVALEFPAVGTRFCVNNPIPEHVRAKREQVMIALRSIRQAQKVYLEAANG